MSALAPSSSLTPGFLVLHGNRSEDLAQTVIAWQSGHPLAPLEEEVILVQSSGMAEWFKMAQAQQLGVCSAAKVELPGRFVWRAYRQVLGSQAVPRESPLDKLPMTWRLMQLLPSLLAQPAFGPMARYLSPDSRLTPTEVPLNDETRWLQLASQLADLFDQYQNYRTDWLQHWAEGEDVLIDPQGQQVALPSEQLWQPILWRALLGTLSPEQRSTTRPELHRQVLAQMLVGGSFADRLPRRVVVFGMSHMPGAFLETLAALARHSQVILAVPNPCRYYWGDIMDGRELFRTQRQRQARREGSAAKPVDLQDMHLHAHPLLAAWGRQGRDFVRQLDAFDDAVATQQAFPSLRIDLFDEATETADTPMLTRVQ
ncbi:MAG: exodeoxyribonuclease subunit gamma, partial [Pseudomonadota bacterium]